MLYVICYFILLLFLFLKLNSCRLKQSHPLLMLNTLSERDELCYTGDTTFQGIVDYPFIYNTPLLITEMTYLDGGKGGSRKWKHMHIDDLNEAASSFHNAQILSVHMSKRYKHKNHCLQLIQENLHPSLLPRAFAALRLFESEHYIDKVVQENEDEER